MRAGSRHLDAGVALCPGVAVAAWIAMTPLHLAAATFVVNTTADTVDTNTADGLCLDVNGNCSLRAAMAQANALPGAHTITFNITGGAPHTIQPSSQLPTMTKSLAIDGTTQPGFSLADPRPVIELDGSLVPPPTDSGLVFLSASNTVRGLAVNRFGGAGILFVMNGNIVEGTFVGTDTTGTNAAGNGADGISIQISSYNRIGGPGAAQRNLISGNGQYGIQVIGAPPFSPAASNVIENNLIGTDITGTKALGNVLDGVHLHSASQTTVTNNLISGNGDDGVDIHETGATGNLVVSNLIGVVASGATALGNGTNGVIVQDSATNNVILGNVVSGNAAHQVVLRETTSGGIVQGNIIGLNIFGTGVVTNSSTNGHGVLIAGAHSNIIGGATAELGNVISGNREHGVLLTGGATSNTVSQNLIGARSLGTFLGNLKSGVRVEDSAQNVIGPGNRLEENMEHGVVIQGSAATNNWILGNIVGDELGVFGSGKHGVLIDAASHNRIGGYETDESNEVSGNSRSGVRVQGLAADHNSIVGNRIAFNHEDGVTILEGFGNTISSNRIVGNLGLGIDLGDDGVTPNDLGDADSGPNDLQNFPVLNGIVVASTTTIMGFLNDAPEQMFTLEFFQTECGPADHGQGEIPVGNTNVVTDTNGYADFTVKFPFSIDLSTSFITATATDTSGNTSEFSPCDVQSAIRPRLGYEIIVTNAPAPLTLDLFWPTNFGGYQLESTTNVADRDSWQPVTNEPIITNMSFRVTLPPATNAPSKEFFRLRQDP